MAFIGSPPQLARSPRAPRQTGPDLGFAPRRLTAASLAATLGLIGAGGFAVSQLGGGGKASPAAAAVPARPPLRLTDRVLSAGAIPGMVAIQSPSVVRSASRWATTVEQSLSPARETARLRALGYVGGLAEQLHGRYPVMAEGISVVEQYRSPAGARAELAYQYARLKHSANSKFATFPVAIPGGHGVSVTSAGTVGLNVMFAAGPYYYVVGTGAPSDSRSTPSQAQLVAAAQVLDLTISGCVGRPDQAT
jgi:hypothetical protein